MQLWGCNQGAVSVTSSSPVAAAPQHMSHVSCQVLMVALAILWRHGGRLAIYLLPSLGLFGVLRPIPVKIVGYNPLSPVYEERMIDVIRELPTLTLCSLLELPSMLLRGVKSGSLCMMVSQSLVDGLLPTCLTEPAGVLQLLGRDLARHCRLYFPLCLTGCFLSSLILRRIDQFLLKDWKPTMAI